jgi:hypothetical protein
VSPLREIGKFSVVDELLVTVALPFEMLIEVGSPHTDSAIPTASSTIVALRLLCFKRPSPSINLSRWLVAGAARRSPPPGREAGRMGHWRDHLESGVASIGLRRVVAGVQKSEQWHICAMPAHPLSKSTRLRSHLGAIGLGRWNFQDHSGGANAGFTICFASARAILARNTL